MMKTNTALLKGMQVPLIGKLFHLQAEVQKTRGGGRQGKGGGKNKDKKRNDWSHSGPGASQNGGGGNQNASQNGGGAARQVKANKRSFGGRGKTQGGR